MMSLIVIVGLTVNTAVGEFVPSVAVIVSDVTADDATVNVADIVPDDVAVVVTVVAPGAVRVTVPAAKPEPVTVVVEPAEPDDGDSEIDAEPTLNVVAAVLLDASVAVTACEPSDDCGMVMVVGPKLPVESVVAVAMLFPAYVMVTDFALPKPVPDTVGVEPTAPDVELIVIDGVTVNDRELDPVAEIVYVEAAGSAGIVSTLLPVIIPLATVATTLVEPSMLVSVTDDPVKPEPVTVTVLPTLPDDELIAIVGLTVK